MSDSKQSTDTNKLRELLRQNASSLTEEALKSGGQVSQPDLDNLDRLARLQELRAASFPTSVRARWPIPVLLGVTLLVISVLLFAHVSETEIELDLQLTGVSFKMPQHQLLTEIMNLSSFGAAGQEEVWLPRVGRREAQTYRESNGTPPHIKLTAQSGKKQNGTVKLSRISVPDETQVWLETNDTPKEVRLTLSGKGLEITADVNGPIEVAIAGTRPEQLDFTSPESIHLRSVSKDINVDLGFADLPKNGLASQVPITDLAFWRIDKLFTDERSILRPASTILSGTLYFESLGGREMRLRPGETLGFASSQGRMRTLALKDGQIAFAFHGTVRGMYIGGTNSRSLMPTYLEWLIARHSLSLLWGTTLYVLGLILSVRTWWRGSK